VLARQQSGGQWAMETVPFKGRPSTLAFDADNHPLIASTGYDGTIALLGTNIPGLCRGDFNLDDAVTSADVPQFVRALRHRADYMADHPGMTDGELLALGDYAESIPPEPTVFDDADARAFLDGLSAAPVPGLPSRAAGFVAFDQADADPALGGGTGNFFGVVLATPKPYQAGDSRGDIAGTLNPGLPLPDGRVDGRDIDYVLWLIHNGQADARADLNGDGVFTAADADTLILDILGTFRGDANLDGSVDVGDLGILGSNYGQSGRDWATGDFNGDGWVDVGDLGILGANYGSVMPPGGPVPEPTAVFLLALGVAALLKRRRMC